jgi:hypothetical protein
MPMLANSLPLERRKKRPFCGPSAHWISNV